jgi:S1-C subfamily serine protease
MKRCVGLLILALVVPIGSAQEKPAKVDITAVMATVRIINPLNGAQGSGVLIHRSGPHVYVLTAQHVVAKAAAVQVQLFTAQSYPRPGPTYNDVIVLAESRVADLAVLRIRVGSDQPVILPLCPPGSIPESKEFSVLCVGCALGQAPTTEEVKISGKKRIQRPGEAMPLWAWECTASTPKGKSGGPLVDKTGRVIGIASGNSSGRGYFTHIQEIHQFLERNELSFLYQEKK